MLDRTRHAVLQSLPSDPLRKTMATLVALMLVLSAFPASLPFLDVERALASSGAVRLWKTGNIDYTSGSWNTHIFLADDGDGATAAYCVEPAKNSPPEGTYQKLAIDTPSGRNAELKADMWFGHGGPGFDASMWPQTNWNGEAMSNTDYYLCTHILLSDTYSSNGAASTHGASIEFKNWLSENIIGFDVIDGHPVNENALGRLICSRIAEVPNDFDAYMIDGGSDQTIAACSAYHPSGNMKMNKTSSNPQVTNGNANYSMEGITYGVYTSPDCSGSSGISSRIVLDGSGYGEIKGLSAGTYYLKEIESSVIGTGYACDKSIYRCDVESQKDSWVHRTTSDPGDVDGNDVEDKPVTGRFDALVQKYDILMRNGGLSGDSTMRNAVFQVEYHMNTEGRTQGDPCKTWRFKTDDDGKVNLENGAKESFVSGDSLYRDPETGRVLFPIGTYAISEVSAPSGYMKTEQDPVICVITQNGTGEHDVDSGALTSNGMRIAQTPVRHDLRFVKRDMDTQRPMGNIPFMVKRIADDGSLIEQHVVLTDANGVFDSKTNRANQVKKPNVNDQAVRIHADGSYTVLEDQLDSESGTWFCFGKDNAWVHPDDTTGSFPDSTRCKYVIEEMPVKANEGKPLVSFEAYLHSSSATTIDLGTVGNTNATLASVASDLLDGDKFVSIDVDSCIKETLSYSGLIAERNYVVKGSAINASDGTTVVDKNGKPATFEHEFRASKSSGEVEIEIPFDSTRLPEGSRIAICESLYEGKRLLAEHEDIDDASQTVTLSSPKIRTEASDARDGDSMVIGDIDAAVTDTVSYSGLVPGKEYTVHGRIMDKSSGQVFVSAGNDVASTVTFVPDETSGTVNVEFEFDASGLISGTELVVVEELTSDGRVVAEHHDLDDPLQTVSVFPPCIETDAMDPDDGDKVVSSDIDACLVDNVSYRGLQPGAEYRLEGKLVDKSTGEALLDPFDREITATHVFTALEIDGTTQVRFDFDASNMDASVEAVVFEELYREDRRLSSHIDINSASQMVLIEPPSITTYASADGTSKHVMRSKEAKLLDAVVYQGLKPGCEYELRGTVADKATGKEVMGDDGLPLTNIHAFIPDNTSGTTVATFDVDTSMMSEGSELVVFEKLFKDGVCILEHEDIDDERQTVGVFDPVINTLARSPNDTKTIVKDLEAVVDDTVSYSNLAPGFEYTLTGTMMRKDTGKPLVDANGDTVESKTAFVPAASDGECVVTFTFDASLLEQGCELVAFEGLYMDDVLLATHEDLQDVDQTVTVMPVRIETTAMDALDGDKAIAASDKTRVIDVVSYEGLTPGDEYRLVGTMMDKEEGLPFRSSDGKAVTSSRSFMAESENGQIEIGFDFDSSKLEDSKDLVIFQELYHDERLIAEHGDYENSEQTVTVESPHISTMAADSSDKDKTIENIGVVSITDTVACSGLIAGQTYEIDGSLMLDDGTKEGRPLKDALGKPCTAHVEFTPTASQATVALEFQIDATLLEEGDRVVAFERLFHDRTLIASHEDLHDEDQTVTVEDENPSIPSDGPDAEEPKMPGIVKGFLSRTGDDVFTCIATCIGVALVALAAFFALKRKGA